MKRILLFFLPFLFVTPAWALDTTEEYSPGFSNFEGYSMQSRSEQTLSVLAGYGQSRWLNLSLGIDQLHDVTTQETQTQFCLGNFSHIYSGVIDADIITQLHSHNEKITAALGTEISYDYFLWTPYLKIYSEINDNQQSETGSLGISRRWPRSGLEVLLEYTQELSETSARSAVGLNYRSNDNFELITEVAYSATEESPSVSVGFIVSQ